MLWSDSLSLFLLETKKNKQKNTLNHLYSDPNTLYPYYYGKLIRAALRGRVSTIYHLTMLLVLCATLLLIIPVCFMEQETPPLRVVELSRAELYPQ